MKRNVLRAFASVILAAGVAIGSIPAMAAIVPAKTEAGGKAVAKPVRIINSAMPIATGPDAGRVGTYVINVILLDKPEDKFGIPLEGATFAFYEYEDSIPAQHYTAESTSDASGKATFMVPYGKYLVRYEYGADEYEFQENEMVVHVNSDHETTEWYAIRNGSLIGRNVNISVVDEDGKKLTGVTLRVKNDKIDRFYTTDTEGHLVISDLSYGTYQISLAIVPAGYVLDTTPKTVVVGESSDVTVPAFVVYKEKPGNSNGSTGSGSSGSNGGFSGSTGRPSGSGGSFSGSGSGSSSSGGSYGSGSSHVSQKSSGSVQSRSDSVVGTWSYDGDTDKWTLDDHRYKNQWVYVYNGYAGADQRSEDWFYFDENGNMMTGWFLDSAGQWYYLNDAADGTRGAMVTGWKWINGKCYYFHQVSDGTKGHMLKSAVTPDGYTVDENGAWTVDGVAVVR